MYGIENLLLNVLFLIVFLLFVPLFVNRSVRRVSRKVKQWIIMLAYCLAIISCMTFPITVIEGFIFDLRWVPLIVGILYGGLPFAATLTIVLIGYRFYIGGDGVYPNIVVSITEVVITILFAKKFLQSLIKEKIIIGSSISLFGGIFHLFIIKYILNLNMDNIHIILYSLFLFIVTAVIIYILELIYETSYLNRKIIKAEKIEVVSHLASSISHEVRNPLTVVRGFLQMMHKSKLSEDKKDEYVEISIKEIDRAVDIIQNYLTFAKPSPEKFDIINVKEELERAIEILIPLANMNSVEIMKDIHPCFIKGEAQIIQQCLLNITKNCIEAMPNSGELFMKTSEDENNVIIEISDNGKGMSEEQLIRVGEPYFTTKGREGTGLGMLTAKRIIELLNGKLYVKSELDKGTQFIISIPKVDKARKIGCS